MTATYTPGSLVSARDREWVVLPESADDMLVLRPLGGSDDDVAALFPAFEPVSAAVFDPPRADDLGNARAAGMLRSALRIGFRAGAGPFRSLAGIAVQPRAYQLVPLLMALRQSTVRMVIADDVGIGKTVEAGLVASELLAQGDAAGLTVLCSPALAEQWQEELRTKFGIDAELVLSSTVSRLERGLDLGQSLFDRHRHTIVSTDFIKSARHRDDFVRHCPDLVIVDEAHTCVAADDSRATRQNQLRYELLQKVAADSERHLLLVTATPHSGKESAFRNLLGLANPELGPGRADFDTDAGRRLLARHFVQRKRADVRQYLTSRDTGGDGSLAEETAFPSDRLFRDEKYRLTAEYKALLEDAIAYAGDRVHRAGATGSRDRRVAWWSAIALLRALVSSPRAASKTLTTRSAAALAATAQEADAIGAALIRDSVDADQLEGLDTAPGARVDEGGEHGEGRGGDAGDAGDAGDTANADESDTADGTSDDGAHPLLRLAERAAALEGPAGDAKLKALVKHLKALLAEGYNPIVFCHYIDTAEYVAEHLEGKLNGRAKDGKPGWKTSVKAVTGTLSPQQRVQRIEEFAEDALAEAATAAEQAAENAAEHAAEQGAEKADGSAPAALAAESRRVLVATDCLSEGVNLQHYFDAVVHYDLAWNPTRHDQREGRVDRYGQQRDQVRVVTLYGEDNGIDGKVLEVLLTKYRQIRKDLGIAVSVPDESSSGVTDAILDWLLLRSQSGEQEALFGTDEVTQQAEKLEADWKSAAEREQLSRSKYAQRAIHPEEVAREVAAVRDALGSNEEVREFVESTLAAMNAPTRPMADGFSADVSGTPVGLRDALAPLVRARLEERAAFPPVAFRETTAVARGEAALVRTDPVVGALAGHVLDGALDPDTAGPRPARRCGVLRTDGVDVVTTLLLVRYRFHLTLPSRHGTRQLVAEDARMLAFRRAPDRAEWLTPEETRALLEITPDANADPDMAAGRITRTLDKLPSVADHLAAQGREFAAELAESHRRVRGASGEIRRGLKVEPQEPADVLGVYVYMPIASASAATPSPGAA